MWAEHNLGENKRGHVGIWEKRMAPSWHYGQEKVQDNDRIAKPGASNGWKEFMRATECLPAKYMMLQA